MARRRKPQSRFGERPPTLKAVAQHRGWNHRYPNHLSAAAYYLAAELNRPDWNTISTL